MKKSLYFLFAVAFTLFLAACGNKEAEAPAESSETSTEMTEEKENLGVTTTFLHDMVSVLEDGVDGFNTELIIPAGEDPHVYEPKASDLDLLKNADIILYHGLDFEGRMADVLSDGVSVTENFDESNLEEMEEDDEIVVDPHFWFDLKLYEQAIEKVKDTLIEHNPEGKSEYEANFNAYAQELHELDDYIKSRIDEIPEKSRILVTPHDAFNYFSKSYGMEVFAPQGVSTDSEVSNNQIQKTADKIVENDIKAIFIETTTNPDRMKRLQEVVKSEGGEVELVSDGNELLSDSLAPQGESGDTFLTMYRHNIDIIVDHLK